MHPRCLGSRANHRLLQTAQERRSVPEQLSRSSEREDPQVHPLPSSEASRPPSPFMRAAIKGMAERLPSLSRQRSSRVRLMERVLQLQRNSEVHDGKKSSPDARPQRQAELTESEINQFVEGVNCVVESAFRPV